jgi:hypothetical protein
MTAFLALALFFRKIYGIQLGKLITRARQAIWALGTRLKLFPLYDMGLDTRVVATVNKAQNGYDGPQRPKYEV